MHGRLRSKIFAERARPVVELVAGSLGGMASVVVGQPFDVIKVRMQMDGAQARSSMLGTVASTWAHEGVRLALGCRSLRLPGGRLL